MSSLLMVTIFSTTFASAASHSWRFINTNKQCCSLSLSTKLGTLCNFNEFIFLKTFAAWTFQVCNPGNTTVFYLNRYWIKKLSFTSRDEIIFSLRILRIEKLLILLQTHAEFSGNEMKAWPRFWMTHSNVM